MSTFTKEQLSEWAEKLIEETHSDISISRTDAHAESYRAQLALLEIALASLEAEPVAFVMADDLKDSSIISTPAYRDLGEAMERTVGDVVALFSAPPAPVSVRDERTAFETFMEKRFKDCIDRRLVKNGDGEYVAWDMQVAWIVWNLRAAMLQGADGSLTNEDTKRVGELVMWVKRLAHSLRKANPDSKLQSDAMEYLSQKGLIGVEDVLR